VRSERKERRGVSFRRSLSFIRYSVAQPADFDFRSLIKTFHPADDTTDAMRIRKSRYPTGYIEKRMAGANDGLAIGKRKRERERGKAIVVFTRAHARMRKSERQKRLFLSRRFAAIHGYTYGRTSTSRMQRNASVPMRYRSARLPPSLICLDGGITVERETTTITSTLTRMARVNAYPPSETSRRLIASRDARLFSRGLYRSAPSWNSLRAATIFN